MAYQPDPFDLNLLNDPQIEGVAPPLPRGIRIGNAIGPRDIRNDVPPEGWTPQQLRDEVNNAAQRTGTTYAPDPNAPPPPAPAAPLPPIVTALADPTPMSPPLAQVFNGGVLNTGAITPPPVPGSLTGGTDTARLGQPPPVPQSVTLPEIWNGGVLSPPRPIAGWETDPRNQANRNGIGAPTPEQFGASVVGGEVRWFNGSHPDLYRQAIGQYQNNQLLAGQQRREADMEYGYTRPDGTRVPGRIENAGLDSWSRHTNSMNTPRAEDVARDQAAEAELATLRNRLGMSDAAGIEHMRNTGRPLSRRMGGLTGQNNTGGPPLPNWYGGGGGASIQPQPGGGSAQPQPTAGPNATGGNVGSTNLPVPTSVPATDENLNQQQTADRRAIATAFEQASSNFPQGEQGRQAYTANPDAYHRAITAFLRAIPDDVLRRNYQEIVNQLAGTNQFGGSEAANTWRNASNDLLFGDPQQQAQIDRILAIEGRQRQPVGWRSPNVSFPERAIGGLIDLADYPAVIGGRMGSNLAQRFGGSRIPDYAPLREMQNYWGNLLRGR